MRVHAKPYYLCDCSVNRRYTKRGGILWNYASHNLKPANYFWKMTVLVRGEGRSQTTTEEIAFSVHEISPVNWVQKEIASTGTSTGYRGDCCLYKFKTFKGFSACVRQPAGRLETIFDHFSESQDNSPLSLPIRLCESPSIFLKKIEGRVRNYQTRVRQPMWL